jgi:hypothetical protein
MIGRPTQQRVTDTLFRGATSATAMLGATVATPAKPPQPHTSLLGTSRLRIGQPTPGLTLHTSKLSPAPSSLFHHRRPNPRQTTTRRMTIPAATRAILRTGRFPLRLQGARQHHPTAKIRTTVRTPNSRTTISLTGATTIPRHMAAAALTAAALTAAVLRADTPARTRMDRPSSTARGHTEPGIEAWNRCRCYE